MTDEHTDLISTNEIEDNSDTEGETQIDRFDNNASETEHEVDIHDGTLTTIPEETESVASKLDDSEQKFLEPKDIRDTNADVTEAAEMEGLSVPVTVEPIISVSENIVSTSKEDSLTDHAAYVEQYKNHILELTTAKQLNILLQKKVIEHFKKRKMDIISKTEDVAGLDLEVKYLQQLQEFTQLKDELSKMEQQRESELAELEVEKDNLNKILEAAVNELVAYVNHTADNLHRAIPKKMKNEMVERLTSKLVSKLEELRKLHLRHIKLRNRVTVQQERKRELEGGGEALQLASYEQLRAENKHLVGRVEERDEELQRLGERAMTTVHTLAHVRQKIWVTDNAVKDKSCQLRAVEEQLAKVREKISAIRKRREHYRTETQQLRQAAGLLTEPAMLRDFEQSKEEATRLSAELQNIKNSFYDDKSKLTNVRGMLQLVKLPDQNDSVQCVQFSLPRQSCIRRK